jgi:hypothetical protein
MLDALERRCRASGLTIDQLEALTVVDMAREPQARSYRETSAAPVRHAVRVLQIAARRLGIDPGSIIGEDRGDPGEAHRNDATALVGALAGGSIDRASLVAVLQWDDQRLARAIDGAGPALHEAGLRLDGTGDLLRLAPATGTLEPDEREAIAWHPLRGSGLSLAAGELLMALSRDPKIQYLELLDPEHRHALQILLDAQLLSIVEDRIILTVRAAVALRHQPWEEAARQQLASVSAEPE